MKSTLEGINSRLHEAEDQINDLEGSRKYPVRRAKRKKIKKAEDSLRDLQDNIKHNNICIIGAPEGEEREQGIDNLSEEMMIENFPNLVKKIDRKHRVPNKMNPKRPTPRHIIIKIPKVKDKRES